VYVPAWVPIFLIVALIVAVPPGRTVDGVTLRLLVVNEAPATDGWVGIVGWAAGGFTTGAATGAGVDTVAGALTGGASAAGTGDSAVTPIAAGLAHPPRISKPTAITIVIPDILCMLPSPTI